MNLEASFSVVLCHGNVAKRVLAGASVDRAVVHCPPATHLARGAHSAFRDARDRGSSGIPPSESARRCWRARLKEWVSPG
jgi:hypothetical protein